jgi:hypothetical protein
VLSIAGADFVKAPQQVTGSNFQNGYMLGKIDQAQVKGRLRMLESSNLNFGLGAIKVNNRSAEVEQPARHLGRRHQGFGLPEQPVAPGHRARLLRPDRRQRQPEPVQQFLHLQLQRSARRRRQGDRQPGRLHAEDHLRHRPAHQGKHQEPVPAVQHGLGYGMPMHTAIGVRYEKTDVTSTALVPAATGISWGSQNEFTVNMGAPTFTTLTGKYHNLLPSVDWDMDVRPDMKVRASYGETIGRPRYDQIAGGQILNTLARVEGGTGNAGQPGAEAGQVEELRPVLRVVLRQAELRLGERLLQGPGQLRRPVAGREQPFGLHTPVGGALWNEALANGCANADTTCIRNYIFRNHATAPGVTRGGMTAWATPPATSSARRATRSPTSASPPSRTRRRRA